MTDLHLTEAWGENGDLRPFPFTPPHEQRISELEAENGRQNERIRKLRYAIFQIQGLARDWGYAYPVVVGFDDIVEHAARALREDLEQ